MSDRSWEHFKDMMRHLREVRKSMDVHMDGKLLRRWKEKGDYRDWDVGSIIKAVKRELKELEEAFRIYGPTEIKDEAMDVVTTLEFLWDVLELRKF